MTFWTRTVPRSILAFLMVIPLLGAAGNGDEASREDFRDISTGGADRLEIEVGAGFLKVIGEDSRDEVRMEATITATGRGRAMAEEILAEVEIREVRKGSSLTLKSTGPKELKRGGFRVDMTVWVPSGMSLEIADGSGDIEVADMRNGVDISDGSGDIEVRSLEGPLEISDGSGDIRGRDLDATRGNGNGGEVRIHRSRGVAVSILGTVYSNLDVDTTATITPEEAGEIVESRSGATLGSELPALTVYPIAFGQFTLVYLATTSNAPRERIRL